MDHTSEKCFLVKATVALQRWHSLIHTITRTVKLSCAFFTSTEITGK